MPNYEMLRGEAGGLPPDGVHDAYLDRAALVDTRNGEMLVTEWRTITDPLYCWSTWFGFEGQRLGFTLDFLDDLGVDRATLADEAGSRLEDALDERIGRTFTVRTARWGSNGGGGVNVEVEGERGAEPRQESLDLPHDPVEVEVGANPDDDDIPF